MPTKKSPGKIKEFTVHRSKWVRGGMGETTSLRTPSGQKCCLGFLATACGFKPDEIQDKGDLDELARASKHDDGEIGLARLIECVPKLVSHFERHSGHTSAIHDKIIRTNDDSSLGPKLRESELKKLFKKAGIKVVFK